jgi:class 3 adenylate cyclase
VADPLTAWRQTRLAVHRSVLVVDVEGYGQEWRTTPHRLAVRDGLDRALRRAFDDTGLPWADCRVDDTGDGAFVLVPPQVPKALLIESLPYALADAVRQHNKAQPPEACIRLRMALHAGEVAFDDRGVTSPAINHAFRLLDAAPVKRALRESPGVLLVVTSDWFFDEVVRHSAMDPATFRPVRVAVKETRATGWLCRPDHPYEDTGSPGLYVPKVHS